MSLKYKKKDFEKVEKYYNNKMNILCNLTNNIMKTLKDNNNINNKYINKLQILDNTIELLEAQLNEIKKLNIINNFNQINKNKLEKKIIKSDLDILFPILYNYINN